MESLAPKHEACGKAEDRAADQYNNSKSDDPFLPSHRTPFASPSKRLSQSDVELSCFDSRYGVQISSNIKSNWPDRSLVSQANAHGVGVVSNEIVYRNGAVDVAAVVEDRGAEPLFNGQRKTQF